MKNQIIISFLLLTIIFFNHSSCGLLNEEKCINEVVLSKSWAGNWDKIYGGENSPNVLFKLNENSDDLEFAYFNQVFYIKDACIYGTLSI